MSSVPMATPVTSPPAETVAIAGVALLHTPLAVTSDSGEVCPTQIVVLPVMAATAVAAFTVISNVALTLPQIFDSV